MPTKREPLIKLKFTGLELGLLTTIFRQIDLKVWHQLKHLSKTPEGLAVPFRKPGSCYELTYQLIRGLSND